MKTNTSTKPDSLPHSLLNTIFVFAAATTLWTTCPTARGQDIFVANVASGTIGEYTTSGATVNASLVSGLSRSEEHTSELQSLRHLVCRLLLEKKKKNTVS